MADRTPRLLWQNLAQLSGSAFTASSQQTAFPRQWMKDQQPTKVWRSKVGWNVVAPLNDRLDFTEGGVARLAFLTPANYADGPTFAAHLQGQMNSAGVWPAALTPTLWLRAESLANSLADGAAVGTWADQSGNGKDFVQATAAQKPTFRVNGPNGRPAVFFDGVDDNMTNGFGWGFFAGTNGVVTMFVVVNPDATGTAAPGQIVIDTQVRMRIDYNHTTNKFGALNDDGVPDTVTTSGTYAAGTPHIGVMMHDGTNVYVGGDNVNTAALASAATGATISVGSLKIGKGTSPGFRGYISEILIFNSALSEENRRRVSRYLSQKYAVTDASTAPTWNNAYTVSYASSAYTIARSSGADTIALPFSTGANVTMSAHRDCGFANTDKSGSTSYAADNVSYHSREWVKIDLQSALDVSCSAEVGHVPLASGGSVSIKGNAFDAWTAPTVNQALAGDDRIQVLFLGATSTLRYWMFLVDDVQNSLGYSQLGVPYIGTYLQPGRSVSVGYSENSDDLSVIVDGDQGAFYQNKKPRRKRWDLTFPRLKVTDKNAIDSMQDYLGVGRCIFMALDPQNTPGETRYGIFEKAFSEQQSVGDGAPADRWTIGVSFVEAVG